MYPRMRSEGKQRKVPTRGRPMSKATKRAKAYENI
jgi:hypothetical protein